DDSMTECYRACSGSSTPDPPGGISNSAENGHCRFRQAKKRNARNPVAIVPNAYAMNCQPFGCSAGVTNTPSQPTSANKAGKGYSHIRNGRGALGSRLR